MPAANALRRTTRRSYLYLFLLLCFFCLFSSSQSDELQLLLKFKEALQKSNTEVFSSWRPDNNICTFTGIVCNSNGSVSEIDLAKQHLAGVLPLDSICELQSLEKLSLGSNFLYGTISEDLKNCSRLQYLDLGSNSFTGPVPDLSSLGGLKFLYLNNSGFSGAFPWSSLAKMTDLVALSLGDNPFDNTTSFPLEVLNLVKLDLLYLTNCSLKGKIPIGIGNLTELKNLELSDNYLSGEIPADIGKLGKLWQLELYNNELTGKFPAGLRNLTSLANFDASQNHIEGDLSELKFLKNLVSLQLFENQLSGEIPDEFGDFKFLVNLSLYANNLIGTLPQKLGSWADFDFIDVSENFLTGSIPPDMCKNGKMHQLLMLQNKFTGEIPASYASCQSLRRFRVKNNSLSGTVPAGIWGLPNVNIIDLTSNQFEGPMTADIGNAKFLTQLFISNNRLSGEIPAEISKASSLVAIDMSSNQFSGGIPSEIGDLNKLNSLHLEDNILSGSIPKSLGSCDSLNDLNFAGNSLSGQIPSSMGSLPTLNSLNMSDNKLSGKIPSSLSSLKLSLLDLSHNQLTGLIPQSLSIEAYNGSFTGNPGLCTPNVAGFQPCTSDSGMSPVLRTLIPCFIAGTTVLLVSLACFFFVKRKQKDHDRSLKGDSWDLKSFRILSFTEQEILNSVKQENIIGKGGSGNVYRVVLNNGKELAVKHIWNSEVGDRKTCRSSTAMLTKRKGKSSEFDAEVATLSSILHVNVVKLYCSITSEDSNLLVYEYLPNGSLWDRLHMCKKMELDWENRYEIAVGAAKGLEYLHHGCERPVIHRDVKSSNILLDEFLKPRIADFGLAKIVQANAGKDTTHVIAGTHGYIAPEYAYTYKVNEKSDVYSFGVVLMELVTGKRPIEAEFGENNDIVYWIGSRLTSKESVMDVVDSRIPDSLKEDAVKVLRIAVLCTARLPALRPSMRTVVQMLEDAEPCRLVGIIVSKNGSFKKEGVENSGKLSPSP
ncbi:hypothetical protein HHK36_002822 [Tetracentron sinense]|uniref:non-specific serine/threonine protein kinase n=1 Tax=Tetracentron sinense TaxID=13715 RepID=A0A835DNQ3_TETSI|nr:hypothetical protein HHK36_002822 [Tetracentron sinense]